MHYPVAEICKALVAAVLDKSTVYQNSGISVCIAHSHVHKQHKRQQQNAVEGAVLANKNGLNNNNPA